MTSIGDQLREQTVNTVLGRIRLQVGGSGSPIVFWPSLLMTGDMWHGVAGDLIARRQVVLVDPPGQGGSQPLTELFSFDECARCVVDILDGLGIDKAHFVGNSWGGMIGGTFAATYPGRIGGAVLMNCTAGRASVRQKVQFAILLASRTSEIQ
jgi:3-oxoadipate enol-lactonase